jgi:hypothetical protein
MEKAAGISLTYFMVCASLQYGMILCSGCGLADDKGRSYSFVLGVGLQYKTYFRNVANVLQQILLRRLNQGAENQGYVTISSVGRMQTSMLEFLKQNMSLGL